MKHLELLSGYSATELMKKLQPAGLCGGYKSGTCMLKKNKLLRTKAECTKQSKKEKRVAGKRLST